MKNTYKPVAIAAIAAAAWAGAAFAAIPSQEEWFGMEPMTQQGAAMTRAEVLADLNLWSRAGLRDYQMGESTYAGDPAYERRLAEYHRMRDGPEFQAEVSRLSMRK